jgi:hypothetical protein
MARGGNRRFYYFVSVSQGVVTRYESGKRLVLDCGMEILGGLRHNVVANRRSVDGRYQSAGRCELAGLEAAWFPAVTFACAGGEQDDLAKQKVSRKTFMASEHI